MGNTHAGCSAGSLTHRRVSLSFLICVVEILIQSPKGFYNFKQNTYKVSDVLSSARVFGKCSFLSLPFPPVFHSNTNSDFQLVVPG